MISRPSTHASPFVWAGMLALGASISVATVFGSSSCTDTATVNTALISGISVNTSELLGDLGCSNEASPDVYKYVAIAIDDTKHVAGAGIFDCFADGVFGNLPGTDGGALHFAIWIYAYNPPDYAAANANNALTDAVLTLNAVNQPDGSVVPVGVNIVPDGGTTKSGYPAALSHICRSQATWVAICSATAQDTVQAVANCGPLSLETALPSACNLPVLIPDAGPDALDAAHD